MSEQYYDAWTDEQIAAMKANEAPLNKLTILGHQWMEDAFRQIRQDHRKWLEVLSNISGWINPDGFCIQTDGIYRLKPGWQPPNDSKWIYCPVLPVSGEWRVEDMPHRSIAALLHYVLNNIVGCGGVEFQEKPGVWCFQRLFVDNDGDLVYSASDGRDCNPATPHRVRFLRNA